MSGLTGFCCGKSSPSAKFRIRVGTINNSSMAPILKSIHYPGIENGVLLVTQIQTGHRMAKPEFAPNFIAEMMKNCWQKEPKERPTFCQMADVIEKQIESVVGIDYLNLNGAENENVPIREIVDTTETNRSEIVTLLNETTKSPSQTEGIENLGFFGDWCYSD